MNLKYTIINHTEDSVLIEMLLTKDLPMFDGHFNGVAIMPAVAQLYIVEKIARKELNVKGMFASMNQIKFVGPISPNITIQIKISYNVYKQRVLFEYSDKAVLKSKGSLTYKTREKP